MPRLYATQEDKRIAQSERQRADRKANPQKYSAYNRKARLKNPEYYKAYAKWYSPWYHRLKKYGITQTEWDTLFVSQGSRCKTCGTTKPKGLGWHTDHQGPLPCTKDKIRGILCCQCNHDIRQGSREDAVRLRAQMQYVESFL